MSLSEYGRLMSKLVREYTAGNVPQQDFDKLTRPQSWQFDGAGRAQPDVVLELRGYLESIEPAEVGAGA